jgi:D-glycero-D-manno-heptose 1,7-bisphosphate phosphatase
MKRAIFLDRDGTIIKDNGYVALVRDVEFYPYTFSCLRQLQKEFLLFIITNQSGIAKGLLSHADVAKIHSYILQNMRTNGIAINEIYYCPHKNEDNCSCKKPRTFFIDEAKAKYSIDILNSYVIGDHPSDVELAINSMSKGIYVLTGHGKEHYHELGMDIKGKIKIHRNLEFATKSILKSLYQRQ